MIHIFAIGSGQVLQRSFVVILQPPTKLLLCIHLNKEIIWNKLHATNDKGFFFFFSKPILREKTEMKENRKIKAVLIVLKCFFVLFLFFLGGVGVFFVLNWNLFRILQCFGDFRSLVISSSTKMLIKIVDSGYDFSIALI